MTTPQGACPEPASAMLDRLFIEHRAKLVDLAAFLDRIERAGGATSASADVRIAALLACLPVLTDGQPERARRILEALSDTSLAPLDHAPPGGAAGAPSRPSQGDA
ncbi:MAG: hypothetical protein AAF288_09240 [Planctomycetota bacterium]